ncbi:MAG: 50S ribosomal protein L11 methyltransferase [Calditrichaceae bacterium]|nr:50S ribosomal protein L11 methyltransferase [Calditrichaceae bacterium]MBN2710048.1 50S ribosomal protein L11 methyltransferase [Calditrichaceae bacterium]RQV91947.1 MAG: 50S ribosomal protein L11 methyltransferase [Calditrichota bacterium]
MSNTDKQAWVRLLIPISSGMIEKISGEIFALGAEGLEEESEHIVAYFKDDIWNQALEDQLIQCLKHFVPMIGINDIKKQTVGWENWNENWKQNFASFRVPPNIIVAPEWENPKLAGNEIVIKISPKMAFGTGHHETTQLILSLLPVYVLSESAVLDAGTGSGILAILAAKSGAQKVVAFDNDPVAIENALENVDLNGVKQQVRLIRGSLEDIPVQKFNLILANINRNVLLDLRDKWPDYITPDGKLILSGILDQDEKVIRDAYENDNWQYIDKKQQGEWIALVFSYKGVIK